MLDISQTQSNMVFQEPFLDSDMVNLTLTDKQAEFVNDMLENPKPLSDTAKAFLRGL